MAFPDGLLNFADSHYRTIRIALIGAILVLAALLGFFILRPIIAKLNAAPVSEYSFKITDGSRHADCQRAITTNLPNTTKSAKITYRVS